MARCCACGKDLSVLDKGTRIVEDNADYLLCAGCGLKFDRIAQCDTTEELAGVKDSFSNLLRDPQTPPEILDEFRKREDAFWDIHSHKTTYEEALNESMRRIMLTTSSGFDGYTVVQYLDVISTEIIFKNSFMDRLDAGVEDLGNLLRFSAQEMSGATGLIEKAKAYVMEKFRRKAALLGANAILGIDFETAFGSDIIRISVNGTAVIIEKV